MENIRQMEQIILQSLDNDGIRFCRINNLLCLKSINDYLLSDSNWESIVKVKTNIKSQLKDVCKKHLPEYIQPINYAELSIQKLAVIENISQRSINICREFGLDTLGLILNYYYDGNNFKSFRNCGKNTQQELVSICEKYKELIFGKDYFPERDKTKMSAPISILLSDDIDLEYINKIENLSVRSYNVCKKSNLTSLNQVIQFYFNNGNSFLSLKNCGITTNKELIKILDKYKEHRSSNCADKLTEDQTSSPTEILEMRIKHDPKVFQTLKDNYLGLDEIPLFSIIETLIDNNLIFRNANEKFIFKNAFNAYIPIHNPTLQAVGQKIGLSRERVRQLKELIAKRLHFYFKFVDQKIGKNLFVKYIKSLERPIILITEDDENQINRSENTKFSRFFIAFICFRLFNDSFKPIGNLYVLHKKSRPFGHINFKNLYLINNNIFENFKINKLIEYLNDKILEKRTEEEVINYEILISMFSTNALPLENIVEVINTIVKNDFNEFFDVSMCGIKFKTNSNKSHKERAVEILMKSTIPLHYKEIFNRMIDEGAKISSINSFHSMLKHENETFGLKGSGIYDLKSKGGLFGTIGDVAEQIINQRNASVPLKELQQLICNELMISRSSINVILFSYYNETRFIKDRFGNVTLRRKC